MDNPAVADGNFAYLRISQIETQIGIIRPGQGDELATDCIALNFTDNSVFPDHAALNIVEGKSNSDAVIGVEAM